MSATLKFEALVRAGVTCPLEHHPEPPEGGVVELATQQIDTYLRQLELSTHELDPTKQPKNQLVMSGAE